MLKSLVSHCDEEHICTERRGTLPSRVIDVGIVDDHSPVRLVETSDGPVVTGSYIVLSYVRGMSRFLTLTVRNIDDLKTGIAYAALPTCFQDAVRVTRALGVRYLWIDALCIILDDSNDWLAESARLEAVFSNAYCRIAATSDTSIVDGLLGPRQPRDAVKIPKSNGTPLYVAEDVDNFHSDAENSALGSRAWVLQERALSRRTIYFTSTQVYWECGNGVVCETLAQMRK